MKLSEEDSLYEDEVISFDTLTEVEFWNSDESRPFMKVWADQLIIKEDRIEVYSKDYIDTIVIVNEYDFYTYYEGTL